MSKKIRIKRFDKSIPLPEYKTKGAAGFDLTTREAIKIKPGEIGYAPLNVAIETPKEHFLMLVARSSAHKSGVMLVNGVGIGDSDFAGDEDEYKAALLNFTKKTVVIEQGTRIAQGIFIKFTKAKWQEVSRMRLSTRGGFGSTGKK